MGFRTSTGQKGDYIVYDCTVLARLKGGESFATLCYLGYNSLRNFFNLQVHYIRLLILTGTSSYPAAGSLLTSGMNATMAELAIQDREHLETLHLYLSLSYQGLR